MSDIWFGEDEEETANACLIQVWEEAARELYSKACKAAGLAASEKVLTVIRLNAASVVRLALDPDHHDTSIRRPVGPPSDN